MPTVTFKETWSDLDHRLVKDAQGRLKKVIDLEAVYTSIANILGTFRGERVMLPEFGSSLRDMVFELIDPAFGQLASRGIKDTIERWDNRVVIQAIDFDPDPDNSFVSLTLRFTVKGFGDILTFKTQV